jgi:hypothetical protein
VAFKDVNVDLIDFSCVDSGFDHLRGSLMSFPDNQSSDSHFFDFTFRT